MSTDVLETGLGALAFARRLTLGLIEDIPPDKYAYQPLPGLNHVLWVLGHIALSDDYFLQTLAGRAGSRFESWRPKFGSGSKPLPDAAAYPSMEELRGYLDERREQLMDMFKSCSPAELAAPLPDDMRSFAANRAVLICTIACHESLHAGQLTTIRKALNLGPKFR